MCPSAIARHPGERCWAPTAQAATLALPGGHAQHSGCLCWALGVLSPRSWFRLHTFFSGDASSFLLCLSRGLKGYSCPQDWAASLKDNDHQKEKANR